jgi:hypothetical protein
MEARSFCVSAVGSERVTGPQTASHVGDAMNQERSASNPAHHDRDRHAYNLAFSELDLGWHWDEKTYEELQAIADEEERLRTYVHRRHGHLLKAYDADFLVGAIRATRSRVTG